MTAPLRLRSRAPRPLVVLAAAMLAGSLAIAAKPPTAGGGSATPQVRVNQVGYVAAASKRAYLMSGAVAAGASFAVTNGATTVASGTAGPDLGAWSNSY